MEMLPHFVVVESLDSYSFQEDINNQSAQGYRLLSWQVYTINDPAGHRYTKFVGIYERQ